MMTESERNAANFDPKVFNIMMEKVKQIDWSLVSGVDDMVCAGWEYEYHEGFVDKTPHYTRYEEDTLRFKKDDYAVQVNLTSATVVIQDLHSEYNYGPPTVFLTNIEMTALANIVLIINDIKRDAIYKLCTDGETVL